MAFEISIKAQEINLGDRLEEYVTSKLEKLDRYINGIMEVKLDLSYSKSARDANDRYIAQITVLGKGKNFLLRSEERADDVTAAFDSAFEKIQRRIEKFKGKYYRGRGDGIGVGDYIPEGEEGLEEKYEESDPPILRRKKFTLVPMDEQEAIMQMEMLGHEDFFVFYNFNTDSVNILYRRRDHSYGLIETEIG